MSSLASVEGPCPTYTVAPAVNALHRKPNHVAADLARRPHDLEHAGEAHLLARRPTSTATAPARPITALRTVVPRHQRGRRSWGIGGQGLPPPHDRADV